MGNGQYTSQPDWRAIRADYEGSAISQRDLAKKMNVSVSTLMKRAMRENWKQGAKLVKMTASKLEAIATEKAERMVADELAPFIEQKKIEITKRGYNVGDRGLSRIEALFDRFEPSDTKAESEAARAAETFLRMARTSLGMSDGTAGTGALNLNILTNQAAVQVNPVSH